MSHQQNIGHVSNSRLRSISQADSHRENKSTSQASPKHKRRLLIDEKRRSCVHTFIGTFVLEPILRQPLSRDVCGRNLGVAAKLKKRGLKLDGVSKEGLKFVDPDGMLVQLNAPDYPGYLPGQQ